MASRMNTTRCCNMTTTVKCKSGITGWQGRLQEQYLNFEEFLACSETYGLAKRLGFRTARAAWDANPMVQGSVIPEDYRVVAKKQKKIYRVFVTRHYIDCRHYDIEETSPRRAKNRAVKTASRFLPDVRDQAVDNGWIADEPVELEVLGQRAGGPSKMKEVAKGVYIDAPT